MLNLVLILFLIIFVVCYWRWDDIRNHFWQKKYLNNSLNVQQKNLLKELLIIHLNLFDQVEI